MTIYLLSYNNYYNRLVKQESSLSAYIPFVLDTATNFNFNPNDGVSTRIIVNYQQDKTPDYALVVDDSGEIVSRWFVIDGKRTRGGQYDIELKRDVVADYYNVIVNAPCFVQKGYVNASSPLIFNSENMSFNQIKMKEYLLDGGSLKTPWIVAYLPRYNGEGQFQSWSGSFADQPPNVSYTLNSLEEYKYYKYSQQDYIYLANDGIYFQVPYKKEQGYNATYEIRLTKTSFANNFFFTTESTERPIGSNPTLANPTQVWQELYDRLQDFNTYDETGLATNTYTKLGDYESYLKLIDEANKVIQVGEGTDAKFYRITTEIAEDLYEFENSTRLNKNNGGYALEVWNKIAVASGLTWTEGTTVCVTDLSWPYQNPGVRIHFQEITNEDSLQYSFNYNHIVTKNTPYEILVAPYYDVTLKHNQDLLAHNGEVALNWFMDMAKAGTIYDIQIVPYVGIDDMDISLYDIAQCYYSLSTSKVQAWAVKLPWSQFSKQYTLSIPLDNDIKQANQCDLYRITSPNGIGNFDFNPAKNGGLIGYEVDCTLIPYNPYIKINPVFGAYSSNNETNLYGGDFNDYRGLICGGDFSLPMVTSAWEEYQVNNKYYQQIFDRQVASLEVQNNWQLAENIVSSSAGVVGGAASGALAGSVVPGLGTVAGAIIGGAASLVGGIVDTIKGQSLYREQIDAMKDQFGYQLQTIKAKPDTLTRTTAYNINNKYFPYIEYYSCTDEEKAIFQNKIKYNGMTVMAIGTIKDYLSPYGDTYVKGKLIRLPEIDDDYHVAQTIVDEILEGVYIQ